jgi:hypothetical protein
VNEQWVDFKTCNAKPNMDVVVENSVISDIFSSIHQNYSKKTVIKLKIGNCVMHFLPHGFDKHLKKITDLVVYYTGLKSITKHDLKQFQLLEYLSITNNDLTFIDGDLLEHSPNVKYIDLRNNKIFYISEKLSRPPSFFADGNDIRAQEYYEKIVTHFDEEIKKSFTLIENLENSNNFQSTDISNLRFRITAVETSIKDIVKVSDYVAQIYEMKESQEKLKIELISVEDDNNRKQEKKIENIKSEIEKVKTENDKLKFKNGDQDKGIELNRNFTKSLREILNYTNGNMTETIEKIKDELLIKIDEKTTQNEVHSLKGEFVQLPIAFIILNFISIALNVIFITIVIILIYKMNVNRTPRKENSVIPNELIYFDPNYDELPPFSNIRRISTNENYANVVQMPSEYF